MSKNPFVNGVRVDTTGAISIQLVGGVLDEVNQPTILVGSREGEAPAAYSGGPRQSIREKIAAAPHIPVWALRHKRTRFRAVAGASLMGVAGQRHRRSASGSSPGWDRDLIWAGSVTGRKAKLLLRSGGALGIRRPGGGKASAAGMP